MTRLWIWLLLLSLVLVVIESDVLDEIDPVTKEQLGVVFVEPANKCTIDAGKSNKQAKVKEQAGFLWDVDSSCTDGWWSAYADLRMEPSSKRRWRFNVTTLSKLGEQDIDTIAFDFDGQANISFPDDENVLFNWKKGSTWIPMTFPMEFIRSFKAKRNHGHYAQYTFELDSTEDLRKIFSVEKITWSRTYEALNITMEDKRFPELLGYVEDGRPKWTAWMTGLLIFGIIALIAIVFLVGILLWRCKKRGLPNETYYDSGSVAQTPMSSKKQGPKSVFVIGGMSPGVGTPKDSQSRR